LFNTAFDTLFNTLFNTLTHPTGGNLHNSL
jgi:hypothetical protein